MLHKVYQVVLFLLLAMVIISPLMQINSPDQFPIAGDDLEIQIICGLCGVGIFLVLARILQLVQCLWQTSGLFSARALPLHAANDLNSQPGSLQLLIPLRI